MNEEKKQENLEKFIDVSMDFDKFAYFHSKAKNYSIIFIPRVEETLSTGERRIAKCDDDSHEHYKKGELMSGVRIEFHNGMKRLEKTKENEKMIAFLREKCEEEKMVPLKRQQLKEIEKPIKRIPENEVNAMLADKDAEIERLKKKAGEPVEVATPPAETPPAPEKTEVDKKEENQSAAQADKDANVPF